MILQLQTNLQLATSYSQATFMLETNIKLHVNVRLLQIVKNVSAYLNAPLMFLHINFVLKTTSRFFIWNIQKMFLSY